MERLSKELKKALYRRSGGQCECTLTACESHTPRRRCSNFLYGDFWKVLRRKRKSADTLRNLRAVCPVCYKHYDSPHF